MNQEPNYKRMGLEDYIGTKVSLLVNGQEFTRWQSYEIESDLLQESDAFSFTADNSNGKFATHPIGPGDEFKLFLDDQLQMTGNIDDVAYQCSADGASVTISGRDKFAFLIDCSADLEHYRNPDLKILAEKVSSKWISTWEIQNDSNRNALIRKATAKAKQARRQYEKEFDSQIVASPRYEVLKQKHDNKTASAAQEAEFAEINASVDEYENKANTAKKNAAKLKNKLYPSVKVEPGESPMAIISREAKKGQFLTWMSHDGKGIISRPEYCTKPVYKICMYPRTDIRYKQNNAISMSVNDSWRDRFSKVTVYGSKGNTKARYGRGASYAGSAIDEDLIIKKLYKPLIITDGDVDDIDEARKRANEEIERRVFESLVLNFTVRDHFGESADGGGAPIPWQIDTLCNVEDLISGFSGTYYITKRRFKGDESGRFTELEMHQVGIWLI